MIRWASRDMSVTFTVTIWDREPVPDEQGDFTWTDAGIVNSFFVNDFIIAYGIDLVPGQWCKININEVSRYEMV